jgi:drug/metabolite transporter (DMT)-like permease
LDTVNRRPTLGHLAASGTVVIWGMTFVSTKILLLSFSPVEILFFRFLVGYLALLIIYPHRFRTKSFREELLFIACGLCGVTLYYLFQNIALTYTLASNVGIIVSVAPLLTAVLAHFFLRGEKLRAQFFAGFVIAIAGIVLIAFNGSVILKLNPLGDVLTMLAAFVWAIYSVLMHKISALGYHTAGSTRRVFLYGMILLVPALFIFDFRLDLARFAHMENLLNILFLGIGASALCFVSWNWAVGILGAVKTSFYIYAVPVITIISSALILKEKITAVALAGGILTLAGLFISEWKKRAKTKSGPAAKKWERA